MDRIECASHRIQRLWGHHDHHMRPDQPALIGIRKPHLITGNHARLFEPLQPRLHRAARNVELARQLRNRHPRIFREQGEQRPVLVR